MPATAFFPPAAMDASRALAGDSAGASAEPPPESPLSGRLDRKYVEVAVGLLCRADGCVLLASRPAGKPYADWWEFSGGKLEPGESAREALVRELQEELGIHPLIFHPWLCLPFHYPHASVRLHCFRIWRWQGEPQAREGQQLRWVSAAPAFLPSRHVSAAHHATADTSAGLQTLPDPLLPAAWPLLRALGLPRVLWLSRATELGQTTWLDHLQACAARAAATSATPWDTPWLLLREPGLDAAHYRALAKAVCQVFPPSRVLLHGAQHHRLARTLADSRGVRGLHLPAQALITWKQNPDRKSSNPSATAISVAEKALAEKRYWQEETGTTRLLYGASVHSAADLRVAQTCGVDYALLGTVQASASHPQRAPLGWETFAALLLQGQADTTAHAGLGQTPAPASGWPFPVLGIGGLRPEQLELAQNHGAHGIALRSAW